jgi:hypothetical protein
VYSRPVWNLLHNPGCLQTDDPLSAGLQRRIICVSKTVLSLMTNKKIILQSFSVEEIKIYLETHVAHVLHTYYVLSNVKLELILLP